MGLTKEISDLAVHRLAAFADAPGGGNPAGVWIGDELPDAGTMQKIAAEVGYSETAFLAPKSGHERTIRYYSPEIEVNFCGHATIATGVVLGRECGAGHYELNTLVGTIPVDIREEMGQINVSLRSIEPRIEQPDDQLVTNALSALHWDRSYLDARIPPMKASAGAWHLVLAVESRDTLASLDYDFDALKALMTEEDLTTLQLIWRENDHVFHARNPFPVGGVVEDPATGAAAAALGGYLREAGMVKPPCRVTILQGQDMGRPSRLLVDIPEQGGIVVSGSAVEIQE